VILVFDLDGTLIDSARDIAESVSELLESYGAPPMPLADVVTMVGDGAPMLVRRALRQSRVDPPVADALARYLEIYDRRLMNHTVPYDGVVESLAVVARRGPLAVLTNKPLGPSIGILEALGLRGFFSRIIGGDSEYRRKPEPAGLLALQSLAPGQQIVMIGDSPADWKTAEAARVPFVFTRYGFGASKFGAAPPDTPFVIDHARELDRALAAIER
jgi:phosphoglycolate phosphatase